MDKRITVMLLAPLFLGWHWFEPAARRNQAGIDAYARKQYGVALQKFLSARGVNPDHSALKHNTAAAMYQLKKFNEALKEFSGVDPGDHNVSPFVFHYSLGNTLFRLGEFQKALDHYRKAILEDPTDLDSKRNYELTLRKLQEQKESRKKPGDSQKKDPDKKREKQPGQRPPPTGARKQPQPREKYRALLQYLSQKEKQQIKKKKRKVMGRARREKDW